MTPEDVRNVIREADRPHFNRLCQIHDEMRSRFDNLESDVKEIKTKIDAMDAWFHNIDSLLKEFMSLPK